MAAKLLEKRFGIKDVSCGTPRDVVISDLMTDFYWQVKQWLKTNDADNDGRLSYLEFKRSLKQFLNINEN